MKKKSIDVCKKCSYKDEDLYWCATENLRCAIDRLKQCLPIIGKYYGNETCRYFEEDGLQNMVFGYRVENQDEKHGLWRMFDGSWNPIFDRLSDGLSKSLPMDDSDLYRQEGKQWFSAAPSKETLKHWFSLNDVLELQELGYSIYEFQLKNTKQVSEFELIFTRDNIVDQKEIEYTDIWTGGEYKNE